MAGYIAFSSILGFFPFIILATNVAALIFGVARSQEAVDALFVYVPEHVAKTLAPVVVDVLANAGGSLLTVSAVAALWFSSNAFEAIRTAFDRAYNVKRSHGLIKGRLISVLCVMIGTVVSMALGLTIVLGPLILALVQKYTGVQIPEGTLVLRYLFGFAVFVGFLLLLHRVLPAHNIPVRRLWAGVLASTVIWIVSATGFSIYLGYTPTYTSTYGTLAGVAITLVFLYITGMAVIFGAEVNAVLAHGDVTED